MAVSSEVLAKRIRAAINDAGLTQQSVADAVGLDPSALSKALAGHRNFKSIELALIAEHLGVSVRSLLSESVQPGVSVAARARPDMNPALSTALERTEVYLDLDQLLSDLGVSAAARFDPGPNPDGLAYQQGEQLSRWMRTAMGIGDEDLPYDLSDLAELLEATLGMDVGFEPLPAGLDGLSVARGPFRLALVNSGVPATRQRFTLAHELGHLTAGDSQDLHVDENVYARHTMDETRANAFAAAFLMPAEAVRAAVEGQTPITEESVADLLGRYGVSLDALAFRLHNLGIVDATGRNRIRSMSSNRIALRSGRVADLQARGDRRIPTNLLRRAFDAYGQGKISVRPLASLLTVDPEQLLDELTPRPVAVDDDADFTESAL